MALHLSQAIRLQQHGDADPMMTLIAPNGVTRIAGANVYAAKLATSPTITGTRRLSCGKLYLALVLTRYHPCPPYRIPQV